MSPFGWALVALIVLAVVIGGLFELWIRRTEGGD